MHDKFHVVKTKLALGAELPQNMKTDDTSVHVCGSSHMVNIAASAFRGGLGDLLGVRVGLGERGTAPSNVTSSRRPEAEPSVARSRPFDWLNV